MSDATGERFIPEVMGGALIEAEHTARYALASQVAQGRRVLDAGCGVGYGTGLLAAAGASTSHGLDLDPSAIENARNRVPSAEFVEGDLTQLPWDDGSFDLVVCFEALEHVERQAEVLDELVRVLAPDGLLMVSSPNPRVYPAGNPFHVHELPPEELYEEVSKRLPNVEMWGQHPRDTSVLVRRGTLAAGDIYIVKARAVLPLEDDSLEYSLAVAGRHEIPKFEPVLSLAPSERMRIMAERIEILAERESHLQQLRDADATIRRLLAESAEPARPERTHGDPSDRIAELEQLCEHLRRESEHCEVLLLESEQRLAVAIAPAAPADDDGDRAVEQQLHDHILALETEIADMRASRSWKVTAPIRAVARIRGDRR